MRKKSYRNLAGIVAVLAILCVLSSPRFMAAEYNFTGTWLGLVGGSGGPTPREAESELGVGCSSGCGHRITLRVAGVNMEKGTAKGKLTVSWAKAKLLISGLNESIREAKVVGNKLTFKTGNSTSTFRSYEAVLNGENLTVTLTQQAGPPETFTMFRIKQ